MPKRTRSGTIRRSRRYTYRGLRRRYSRKRVSRTSRGRLGLGLAYRFHRWTRPSSGSISLSQCTYDAATGILAPSISVQECRATHVFRLDEIPNLPEFTALFDQYRLTKVTFQIKMISNPDAGTVGTAGAANAAPFYPTIWYVPDFDDNFTVTLAQIREFAGVRRKVLRPNQITTVTFRPRTLTQIYNSAVSTGYAVSTSRSALDIAQSSIPHYALKYVIDFEGLTLSANGAQNPNFKIDVKYYFSCYGVR